MKPDLRFCLLQIVCQRSRSSGRQKTFAAGYQNLPLSVNLAAPPAEESLGNAGGGDKVCKRLGEVGAGLGREEQRDPPGSPLHKSPHVAADYGQTPLQIERRAEQPSSEPKQPGNPPPRDYGAFGIQSV